jgi:hypothetical protein
MDRTGRECSAPDDLPPRRGGSAIDSSITPPFEVVIFLASMAGKVKSGIVPSVVADAKARKG